MTPNQSQDLNISRQKMTFLLACLVAIMPFSIDIYLPAIPAMASALQVNIHRIELSIASFMFGTALGQLFGGSISDIKGRRGVALIGISIYVSASVMLIFIQSVDALLICRWIQALGAGMATVTAAALVRDYFSGTEAAKIFTSMAIITMIAPLIAPLMGSALIQIAGWRTTFVFLAIYSIILLIALWRFMPDGTVNKQALTWHFSRTISHNFISVFKKHQALGFLFFQALSFSSMIVFITESAFVYMNLYHLEPHHYAMAFGANIITMMLFNRINAFSLRSKEPRHILRAGILIQWSCNFLLSLAVYTMHLPPFWLFISLIMLAVGTQGLIMANTQALFMSYFAKLGGSANAVLGTIQSLLGACISWITTALHNGSALIMPAMMLACTTLGICLLWAFSRHAWREESAPSSSHT